MKTIKERAEEYAGCKYAGTEFCKYGTELNCDTDNCSSLTRFISFSSGAKSEREELAKWHNPKIITPYTDEEVLVMVHRQFNTYDVMRHDLHGWWQKAPGGGWCAADCEIIGWRPIHENK